MALITKFVGHLRRNLVLAQPQRTISVSPVSRLKEIIERKEGKTLIIEAKIFEDPKERNLLEGAANGACLLCSAGVDVKYTDVLILKQFLKSNGGLLPKRITGLCTIQQKRLIKLVVMAQRAGLLPSMGPPKVNRNPKQRPGLRSFNVYYDEKTIEARYYNVAWR